MQKKGLHELKALRKGVLSPETIREYVATTSVVWPYYIAVSRVQQLFNLPSNESPLCSLHQSSRFRRHNVKAGVCGTWATWNTQYQLLHHHPLPLQWHLRGSAGAAAFSSLGDAGRMSSVGSQTISSFQPVCQRDSQTNKPSNPASKHQGALFSKDSQRGNSV